LHCRRTRESRVKDGGGSTPPKRKDVTMSLNHITIMGRMVKDPELRRTGSGTAVASFTLAVDRDFAPKDGGEKETDFVDCVAWRQTGEFVSKYFSKGRMAVVSGRLQVRGWTDKEGNKRRTAEVVADNVYFGDSKKDGDNHAAPSYAQPAPAQDYSANNFDMLEDDDSQLPF